MDISSHSIMPCVMVVDDHGLSRLHTVQALRQIDCRVKQAASGEEALRSVLLFQPDLIFLDFHLPDMSGFSLLHKIWQAWPDRVSKPKTAMLSGDTLTCSPGEMNAFRIVALLAKPVEAEAISHLARQHLQQMSGIREASEISSPAVPPDHLLKIFFDDLEQQLPLLDHHLTNLTWKAAKGILHQVIAASSICREKAIEQSGRLLNESLTEPVHPVRIAQAYHGLRIAVSRARKTIRQRG